MDKLELKALGKINLGLDVLGIRDDGYHEVRMIMQSIYLYDDVFMEKIHSDDIEISSNLFFLPNNEKNLAYKAAKIIKDRYNIDDGVRINLKKRIPVSAGMAGGSTDAASVLYGMNLMFKLGLSYEKLCEIGVELGADVPYCILRGTMEATGIGEILRPLTPIPNCFVLIVKPEFAVSTRKVYADLDALNDIVHPDIDGLIEGLENNDLEQITGSMGNVLEQVVIPKYPVIDRIKNVMKSSGALGALMSGSGPTVYGIYNSKDKAIKTSKIIKKLRLSRTIFVTNIHYPKKHN
ncbi:MAG: 4-(cytidine 5'-diphospho)-2-C-methyl-D-erythritol kinase [Lachnospiraceae bacterium]|jgi:4-diphosphocytidyl-2-C-methyl-D-erythritol kinase|nr:4-(cytidine 5'-diphospho)-2-C-methyl-D-erythritol kinase [Lachnospiraceae bacterium]